MRNITKDRSTCDRDLNIKRACTLILAVLLCLSALGMSSCSCADSGGEVSVLYYTYADTYISSVRGAMDRVLAEAGIKYHSYDANSNQTTQTEQVDTAIAKGARMLIVNAVDTGSDDAARAIVEKARRVNIPLIFFNRSVSRQVIESYDNCVFVGTDYEMAGHLQGQMIGQYLIDHFAEADINGDGRVSYVLFKGQQGNAEAEARTRFAVEDAQAMLREAGVGELVFYDKSNPSGYIVDQDGNWSNAAANNAMKTILSAYSESGGNMVELVIANNDEMALGALAALQEAGYNKRGSRTIPIFGIDATEAARARITAGEMTGTVVQDGGAMADIILRIIRNYDSGASPLDGIDAQMIEDGWKVNIPYSLYTQNSTDNNSNNTKKNAQEKRDGK